MSFIKKLFDTDIPQDAIAKDETHNIEKIRAEFHRGFEFIKKYPRSVTIFGSARFSEANPHYKDARELARRITSELKYAVVTGGGPGIMEGANRGALEGGGDSVGLTIRLPREQHSNHYLTAECEFNYFFVRKTMLTFAAESYVFFPGGFGTMDEFFDITTLVQNKKIPRVPIILVGADFWRPIMEALHRTMLEKHQTISPVDMDLFTITENFNKALEIISSAPVRDWWLDYEAVKKGSEAAAVEAAAAAYRARMGSAK